ncbi:MAG: 16S rRNA (guanine(966)-N(2))-methyltransferase RsmD [Actinomycetia bacterium]|nr:16S rRNA (guanine(966)-N(2))-methyltransferase RsmD [Actinomycetes bacterium]
MLYWAKGRRTVRVIGGRLGGRRLRAPRGTTVRPTLDRVREALFAILAPAVAGARVLDLFAGTGALGIEALSRGAAEAVLVEPDPGVRRVLAANLQALDLGREARILPWRAEVAVRRLPPGTFDLVLCDPPWTWDPPAALLDRLAPLLRPPGWLVWEADARGRPAPVIPGLTAVDRRRYGRTTLVFWRAADRPRGAQPAGPPDKEGHDGAGTVPGIV